MVEEQANADAHTPLTAGGALWMLRNAVVFEKAERSDAPYEAKLESDRRINDAHCSTIRLVALAHQLGAKKTQIAEQLGIKNLNRVTQLITEGQKSTTNTTNPESRTE